MNYKDIIDIIFEYRSDVWQNWTLLVTSNVAIWGWLVQRHGLYSIFEKVIVTIGYTCLVYMIGEGMYRAYDKLDLSVNELYQIHTINQKKDATDKGKVLLSENGIIKFYLTKSPDYIADRKKKAVCKCEHSTANHKSSTCSCGCIKSEGKDLKAYSSNFWKAFWSICIGWVFSMVLFWSDMFWVLIRKARKS